MSAFDQKARSPSWSLPPGAFDHPDFWQEVPYKPVLTGDDLFSRISTGQRADSVALRPE